MMDGIEFRWLESERLDQLDPIYQALGWVPLNRNLSRALVAFEAGLPVGIAALACLPHIDLWVDVEHRGSGLAEDLTKQLVEFLYAVNLPEAYVIARTPHVERLAEEHGMERLEFPVYYKRGR